MPSDEALLASLRKAAMVGEVTADAQPDGSVGWTPLASSNLAEARYLGAEGRMEVLFRNGQVYSYECGRGVFDGLVSAGSPGGWFRSNVRGRFRFRREA